MTKIAYIPSQVVLGSTPSTPESGCIKFYQKSDNEFYWLNDSNVETLVVQPKSLSDALSVGNTTGTNDIKIDDTQVIKATNGNSFLNLREANINGQSRLHGEEVNYITTGFRKKIVIGGTGSNGSLPAWQGANSIYQQVQINGVNLRGNISFGSGLNSSSQVIGIGSEYTQIRFGNLWINNNADLVARGNTLNIYDSYNNKMVSVYYQLLDSTYSSKEFVIRTGSNATGSGGKNNVSGILNLEHSFWDTNNSVSIQRNFKIQNRRYLDSSDNKYKGYTEFLYNGVQHIKILESGDTIIGDHVVGGYKGIKVDNVGKTMIGTTTPHGSTFGLTVEYSSAFHKDVYMTNGVLYMYGGATTTRGWLYSRTSSNKFIIGGANSQSIQLELETSNIRHTELYTKNSSPNDINNFGQTLSIGSNTANSNTGNGTYASTLELSSSAIDGSTIMTKKSTYSTSHYDVLANKIKSKFIIDGTTTLEMYDSGVVSLPSLPTSSVGLNAGDLWNNNGVINIV